MTLRASRLQDAPCPTGARGSVNQVSMAAHPSLRQFPEIFNSLQSGNVFILKITSRSFFIDRLVEGKRTWQQLQLSERQQGACTHKVKVSSSLGQ